MAKASNGPWASVAGIGVVLVVLYLVWRWLAKPKAAQAATAPGGIYGGYGGGYGANGVSPYTNAAAQGQSNNTLGNLLNALLGKSSGASKGGGSSSGSGGNAAPGVPKGSSAAAYTSLGDVLGTITGLNTLGAQIPLAQLGGASLASYSPGASYSIPSIPYEPVQNFDVPSVPIDTGFSNIGDLLNSYQIDTSNIQTVSPDVGQIDYIPTENFDFSS